MYALTLAHMRPLLPTRQQPLLPFRPRPVRQPQERRRPGQRRCTVGAAEEAVSTPGSATLQAAKALAHRQRPVEAEPAGGGCRQGIIT